MDPKYLQKGYTMTAESLADLKEISNLIGDANMSATLRYSVKFTLAELRKQQRRATA